MKVKVMLNGRPTYIELKFKDFYMTSGWRFTSTINFLVETIVTHTCLARNVSTFYKVLGEQPKWCMRYGRLHVHFMGQKCLPHVNED